MIRSLPESAAVGVDRPAVEAGPAMLAAGGSGLHPRFDRTAVESIAATCGATRGKPAAGDKADST